MIAAMNVLGYAACTLGNHEFNYGLDFLEARAGGREFSGGLLQHLQARRLVLFPALARARARLPRRNGRREQKLRIGIIGFTPPQIVQWDHSHLAGRVDDRSASPRRRANICRSCALKASISSSRSAIPAFRARAAPQPARRTPRWRWPEVPGIDAMFLGHQHLVLPGADFAGVAGVDVAGGRALRRSRFHAGLLGQPSRRHRSHAGAPGVGLAGRRGQGRGAPDLCAQRRRSDAARRGGAGRARRRAAGA